MGRELEAEALSRALADRRPVLVTGEPGVGKTALLRDAAAATGRPVFEGGALATLSWLDYLPLTRALGRDLSGADPDAVALEVQQAVGEHGVLVLDDLQWGSTRTHGVVAALAGQTCIAIGVRTGAPEGESVACTLEEAGFQRIALGPLGPESATELTRRVRPDLSERDVAAVVRRAGGNPLLLRELAVSGDEAASLRRTVAARLRRLSPGERDAFALIALAGRPLDRHLLDAGSVAALELAGLVDEARVGHVDVHHALFAEATVEALSEERRRALHLMLADMLEDPGESARHYDLAGERERSRTAALEAAERADRPGERASHLRIAALNATGAAADDLRLGAAESLEAAHDWDGLFAVLDQLQGAGSETLARASLLRARAAWSGGRVEELEPALEVGLGAAAEVGGDVEILLRIEACRVPIFIEGDFRKGAERGREAYELAIAAGVGVARAEYFLGTALACLDLAEGADLLEKAVEHARASDEVSTELTAANNLIAYHESSASPLLGAELARRMATRGRELGLGYWEANFASQALQLDFHAGRYAGLVDALEELAARPLDPRTRYNLTEMLCMTLTDVGRPDESIRVAEQMMEQASAGDGRPHFWFTIAAASLWGGDPRRAATAADRFLTELPESNPNWLFGVVTRAWARFELGEDPTVEVEPPARPMLFGVPHELGALSAAHAGRLDEAVAGFRTAAALWAPYHFRGELRCEWAAGEMLRRAGELDEAIRTLTMVEKRCAEAGLVAILNRALRSLRAAGERRSVPRSAGAAGLTGREQEVLGLVGKGLTNEQVAQRLGITRRTVVAQIASAAAKLGADNRNQAAAIAARLLGEP
jgi:DNA-binding CsgD family transcriptional regulator